MDFEVILLFLAFIWGCGVLGLAYYYMVHILTKKIEIKEKEVQNSTYDLFMKVDPKQADEALDDYIEKVLNDYVLDNIISKDVQYVKKADIHKMVKEITKTIVRDMSELYVFYCKLLSGIGSEDDLINFIFKKVSEHVLIFVTDFNKPKD